MSSHMLAPFGRVWEFDRERDNEPDDEQMQVLCEECDAEPAMFVARDGRVVCPMHFFTTFKLEPLPTVRVHVNDPAGYDVYIGRAAPRRGLASSKWRNPFKIGKDGNRATVVERYEIALRDNTFLFNQLTELAGKRIACWCGPDEACHGDVLVKLIEEFAEPLGRSAEWKASWGPVMQAAFQSGPKDRLQDDGRVGHTPLFRGSNTGSEAPS